MAARRVRDVLGVLIPWLLPSSGKILVFNNDLTNIESCWSPFHPGIATSGPPFTLNMLNASVTETANRGFDVHELAPGCCYVPWWNNSSAITIAEHVEWWTHTFYKKDGSLPPNRTEGYMEHLMKGGDILGPFITYARASAMKAFISWRMADSQAFANYATRPLEDQFKDTAKFWYENRYNATMGLHFNGHYWTAQNWMVKEVRTYKMTLLQEIITRYKPDGISLDFLRAPDFFNLTTTCSADRHATMGAWVRQLKQHMVAGGVTALSARVPPHISVLDAIGLDLAGLTADGTLDFVTFGINYYSFMMMDSDVSAIAQRLPHNFLTLWEVSYAERAKRSSTCPHGPDQRMTAAHLTTSAHQAYAFGGVSGIASFNFQYYRKFADKPCMERENEPYSEPPYDVLAALKDPDYVARQHQFYWSNSNVACTPGCEKTFLLAPPAADMAWQRGAEGGAG